MHFSLAILIPACILPSLNSASPHNETYSSSLKLAPQPLNVTVIAANDKRESVFQCWSIAQLDVATTPGISGALLGSLGTPSTLNFFDIPPKLNGGLHNAPAIQ